MNFYASFQTASSSGDPHVHIVKQVDSADEGLYTCIAGNVLGQGWITPPPSWNEMYPLLAINQKQQVTDTEHHIIFQPWANWLHHIGKIPRICENYIYLPLNFTLLFNFMGD